MPDSGLTTYDAARFRRHITALLTVLVVLVVVILAVSLLGIYVSVTETQHEIRNAIESGPENTQKALCLIFEMFDRLSEYHGFPPATDEATQQACARLADA